MDMKVRTVFVLACMAIANSFQGEDTLLELAFELQDRMKTTPVRWFQFVLVPEFLNLLIMEDLVIPYEKANEMRMESTE